MKAQHGSDDAMRAGNGHIQICGQQVPRSAANQRSQITVHKHSFSSLIIVDVEHPFAYGVGNLIANQNSAQNFEDGGQNASLLQGQHTGTYTGSETVGNIIGSDTESQEKGNDKNEDE